MGRSCSPGWSGGSGRDGYRVSQDKPLPAKQRFFVEAYLSSAGNGTQAARRAGYRGSDKTLGVQAVRLLGKARVQTAIQDRLEKAVRAAPGVPTPEEVIERLTRLARMPDTETVDVFDFVTLISPESGNLNGAKGALKMAGMGFYIDLEKAKDAGLGRFVREISHDAQTGAPRLKLQDNLAMMELARKALADLARIYGMENARPAAASPVEDSRRLIAAVLENGDPKARALIEEIGRKLYPGRHERA